MRGSFAFYLVAFVAMGCRGGMVASVGGDQARQDTAKDIGTESDDIWTSDDSSTRDVQPEFGARDSEGTVSIPENDLVDEAAADVLPAPDDSTTKDVRPDADARDPDADDGSPLSDVHDQGSTGDLDASTELDACVPQCENRMCGDDGCGGACGTCVAARCDGLTWTSGQSCVSGACLGDLVSTDCLESAPCMAAQCDDALGCMSRAVPDGTTCGVPNCNGLFWNPPTRCIEGLCSGRDEAMLCEDGDPCSDDACIDELGCMFSPIDGVPCDDADPCTTGDTCVMGACVGTASLDCDDVDPCTTDSCEARVGCHHEAVADGVICETGACDGKTWIAPRICVSGICMGSATESCDDAKDCTVDVCAPASGCTNAVQSTKCLIEGICYSLWAAKGKCVRCNGLVSATSWTYVTGFPCDDGNDCTESDRCSAGGIGDEGCVGRPYSCDDGLVCTTDLCDGDGGCNHLALAGTCAIDQKCWRDGELNPSNPCNACRTELSTTSWRSLANGSSCGTYAECYYGRCCLLNDHQACSGSNLHWFNSCGYVGDLVEACPHGCWAGSCLTENLCPPIGLPQASPLFEQVAGKPMPDGFQGTSLAIGDLDNDGLADVVAGACPSGTGACAVAVFLSKGGGVLGEPTLYPTEREPRMVAIGDVNGDGWLDVVATRTRDVAYFLNRKDGTLEDARALIATQVAWGEAVVAVADFNSDGRADVLASGNGAEGVDVWFQDDQGGLGPSINYPCPHPAYLDIAVADLNDDGRDDVAISSEESFDIQVLYQAPGGGFMPYQSLATLRAEARGVGIGDLDGNCHADIVWTNGGNGDGSVRILPQAAPGVFGTPLLSGSSNIPEDVAVTDVDGDGRNDVVVRHAGGSPIGIYRQLDGGKLSPEERLSFATGPWGTAHLAVGDISGDGRPDIITIAYFSIAIAIHK